MIDNNDISVIVQGLIIREDDLTERCLKSIRKTLPGSKIVLSTWSGSNLDKLNFDILVLSKDPGFIEGIQNANRQIVGRLNALKKCSSKYVLIIRSDGELVNANFIKAFEEYRFHKFHEFHFLEERIVCGSMGAIHKNYPCLYHINDWFYFGLKDDLSKFLDIALFIPHDMPKVSKEKTPHGYLMQTFVEKYFQTGYKEFLRVDKRMITECIKIILENFICIGFENAYGIINNKEPYKTDAFLRKNIILIIAFHCYYNFEIEDYIRYWNKYYGDNRRVIKRTAWYVSKLILVPMSLFISPFRIFEPIIRILRRKYSCS